MASTLHLCHLMPLISATPGTKRFSGPVLRLLSFAFYFTLLILDGARDVRLRLQKTHLGETMQVPSSRWDEIVAMALEQAEWILGEKEHGDTQDRLDYINSNQLPLDGRMDDRLRQVVLDFLFQQE